MQCVVFFFKQKTAYERRISDWSSDVCSSDLRKLLQNILPGEEQKRVDPLPRVLINRCNANRVVAAPEMKLPVQQSGQNVFSKPVAVRIGDRVIDAIGRASCRESVVPYV